MLIGPEAGREVWFTPAREQKKLDEDEAYQATRYLLRVPTALDQVHIGDAESVMDERGVIRANLGASALVACRRCLIGWENQGGYVDGKAVPVEFEGTPTGGASDKDVGRIFPAVRQEIKRKLVELMEVTEEDLAQSA